MINTRRPELFQKTARARGGGESTVHFVCNKAQLLQILEERAHRPLTGLVGCPLTHPTLTSTPVIDVFPTHVIFTIVPARRSLDSSLFDTRNSTWGVFSCTYSLRCIDQVCSSLMAQFGRTFAGRGSFLALDKSLPPFTTPTNFYHAFPQPIEPRV